MARSKIIPVIEELRSPLPPEEMFAALSDLPYSFFLDSSLVSEKLGRYSFFGCEPFLVFKSKADRITLERQDGSFESLKGDPFTVLKSIFGRYEVSGDKNIPLVSGGVGYFSYDLKRFVEELPNISMDDMEIPDSIICFYDVIACYDNLTKRAYISSSGLPEEDPGRIALRAGQRLKEFKRKLSSPPAKKRGSYFLEDVSMRSNFSKDAYIKAVLKAKEHIKCGNIYQVNLSQRFEAQIDVDPFDLYSHLRKASPAPFSAYLGFGDVAILSSSPERFLLKNGDYIETRPIKGTRPRGADPKSDALLAKELLASPKDRAEHIMIVDLERNDLGRICEYGSVKPEEFVILERYANVFHLVSTVTGKLKDDVGAVDCLKAAFPGGSITGAPKIRAMEIIEELEPVKRSVYTGAIGYMSFDGKMDTSIAIRTFIVKRNVAYFQVGGGIVADSDPALEYEETLHKAKGLIEALKMAQEARGGFVRA
jgi:para-aminobenzoate synthetase component 1